MVTGIASAHQGRTVSYTMMENYLNICFLTPVVKEFDQINKFFQATNADPEAMSQQLNMCYVALKRRVCDDSGNELATSRVDFGATLIRFGSLVYLICITGNESLIVCSKYN